METLRDYTERRFRFSLRRFGHRVKRLRVSVEDLNGPRGGVDKRCRIIAEISPSGRLVIEEADVQIHEAVDRAADRLRRSIRRELKRREACWLGNVKAESIRYPRGWQPVKSEA